MAISISISPTGEEDGEIEETTRAIRTVNATITASADDGEIINLVDCVLQGISEPGLSITPGNTSVTIAGKFADPFLDVFKYVSKGSSDKIENATVVVGVVNVPPNKELFDLSQDTKLFELKTYTITVTYDDTETQEFTVTQKILNDLEGIRSFMDTYYD
jgi:hypothetical protein